MTKTKGQEENEQKKWTYEKKKKDARLDISVNVLKRKGIRTPNLFKIRKRVKKTKQM